ncbi:MAG: N-acetyltransferase [Anaerolineae bacterium]|nr:N-acetyltransferase [Anaerolineae bacterium]
MAIIRLATIQDAGQIQAIYAPIVRDTVISFEQVVPSAQEIQHRISETLVRLPWLVCEKHGEILSYAYAGPHRTRVAYQWSVDTTVYVHARVRRAGIGRALYTALFQILCRQGYINAYAGIALPNPGSVGLHEAVGFEPVGVYRDVGYKQGAWHDVGWWQRRLQPKPAAPEIPLDIGVVQQTPEWPIMLTAGESLLRI